MLSAPFAEVSINSTQSRFELRLNGDLVGIMGFYEADPVRRRQGAKQVPVISYMHTVITEDFGHRGLAAALVQGALEHARALGWRVRPVCTYVQRFLVEHPDYRDIVIAPQPQGLAGTG